MMNASSKYVWDKHTKELLKYSEGKPSLLKLVNKMIRTMYSYIAYIIDHTPGSCC